MSAFVCKKEKHLTDQEKGQLASYLKKQSLSDNVWDLFTELIGISTPNTGFFYIKVFKDTELYGIGLFLKVTPYDFSDSNVSFKNNLFLKSIVSKISRFFNHSVYFSFRFLTANLTRPFFFKNPDKEDQVLKAMLDFIRQSHDADMVIIMDSSKVTSVFQNSGFTAYKAPSETWIDPTRYPDISQYLNDHRSMKKHISQKKKTIISQITRGPVSPKDIGDMMQCLYHSIDHSKMNTPLQNIFEKNIYDSELFCSNKYLYINIRINGKIVGFTNYIISGSNMSAIIGGYNREYTRNNYIYERLFITSLEYAINHHISRLSYGMVDNLTKIRLTEMFDPIHLYIYASNMIFSKMIDLTHTSNDIYQLCLLEQKGMEKYHPNHGLCN